MSGHCRGVSPLQNETKTAHRARAGDVRAQATPGSLSAPTERRIFIVYILWCVMMYVERKMIVVCQDLLIP
jgi:hypothetical protein